MSRPDALEGRYIIAKETLEDGQSLLCKVRNLLGRSILKVIYALRFHNPKHGHPASRSEDLTSQHIYLALL